MTPTHSDRWLLLMASGATLLLVLAIGLVYTILTMSTTR